MHFFGVVAFWIFFLSGLVFIWMIYLKFFESTSFIQTPLPTLAVFLGLMAIQFIFMGLLSEMIYRLVKGKDISMVEEEIVNQ